RAREGSSTRADASERRGRVMERGFNHGLRAPGHPGAAGPRCFSSIGRRVSWRSRPGSGSTFRRASRSTMSSTLSTPLPRVSRWRRVLAVVLTISRGWGRVLLGRWKRGAGWLGACLLLQASIPLLGLPGFVLMLGTIVGGGVDVARLPPRAGGLPR